MLQETKQQIIEAMETYIATHKMSQNEFCKASGVNPSYLINIRKGDFTVKVKDKTVDIDDKYFLRIASLIEYKLETNNWEKRPTPQFRRTIAHLQDALDTASVSVIIGETGAGKTFSLDAFKSIYPVDVFTIKAGSSDNLTALLTKLGDALSIKHMRASKSDKIGQIILRLQILKELGRKVVLAIDEAEYLKQPGLCAVKEIIDSVQNDCGIVLIGTQQLISNLQKLVYSNKQGMPQLWRRLKFRTHYLPAIDRTFEQFLNGYQTPLKKWLQANCDNYGELHDVLVPAMKEAERTGQELTEGFVKMALGI